MTVPVLADSGDTVVGAVVLSRSSAELEERVGVLWAWLAASGWPAWRPRRSRPSRWPGG